MSGFLVSAATSAATAAFGPLPDLSGGLSVLRPGSFKGVPFVIDSAANEGGRRIVVHEFPLRDRPSTEDLGRVPQRYRLKAFVIGPDYMSQRDALLAVCQDSDTPGTLIHPYLGELQCRAGILRWAESKDRGGLAAFDLEFVEDGSPPSPLSVTDTSSSLLGKLIKLLPVIKRAYAVISMAIKNPGYLLGFATSILGGFAESMLGLPAGTIIGLESGIRGLSGSAGSPDALADGVLNVFAGAALNVVTVTAVPLFSEGSLTDADPFAGTALAGNTNFTANGTTLAPTSDLTGGLIAFSSWGGDLPVITPTTPVLASMVDQQAAIVSLIQNAATVAVLQVYAAIDWPSADAALAALGQVLDLVDTQADAAAAAGADDLYRGWQSIAAAAVEDLTVRAQQLPRLARYALPMGLPALALSQRLYQDGSRAGELVGLNHAAHPLFMERTGYRLTV
jgi:hypothetical protein